VPHQLLPASAFGEIGRIVVAQTLLSVLLMLGIAEKIGAASHGL
jgi:hypothetical protein